MNPLYLFWLNQATPFRARGRILSLWLGDIFVSFSYSIKPLLSIIKSSSTPSLPARPGAYAWNNRCQIKTPGFFIREKRNRSPAAFRFEDIGNANPIQLKFLPACFGYNCVQMFLLIMTVIDCDAIMTSLLSLVV